METQANNMCIQLNTTKTVHKNCGSKKIKEEI